MRTWAEQKAFEKRLVDRARKRWITAWSKQGKSARQVSEIVGVDRGYFRRDAARLGVKFPRTKLGKDFSDQDVIDCFNAGMSAQATAEQMGLSRSTITEARKRLGIKGYPPRWKKDGTPSAEPVKHRKPRKDSKPKTALELMQAEALKVRNRTREAWS